MENALDSLDEGIERFLLNRRPSDLKYSVLHIAQAVELFLKARLVREHPLLIYVNPAKAGEDQKTVDFDDLFGRLIAAGVNFDKSTLQDLRELQRTRNRLQHHRINLLEETVRSQIGQGTRFLEGFIEREFEISLKDRLSKGSYTALQKAISSYAESLQLALAEMQDDLNSLAESVRRKAAILQCDFCGNGTIIYPDPTSTAFNSCDVHCYFCNNRSTVTNCPECDELTLGGQLCEACVFILSNRPL